MTETNRNWAELFVDAFESYGITHLFGNPGTTELPVIQALMDCDLEYVLLGEGVEAHVEVRPRVWVCRDAPTARP